jgi:prepilin-type N-terminal cleavage/methylation domain-containing protein
MKTAPHASPPDRTRGLTLLELAMVMAVVAILGALAVPTLSARMERQRTQAAAEKLVGDLSEARFEAAQRGLPLTVWTQPGTNWCWAVATSAGCDCNAAQNCLVRTVKSADHPGVRMTQGQTVQLDPGGTAIGGVANGSVATLFETRRGERLRVMVSALGRPRVCAESGTWPHVPAC